MWLEQVKREHDVYIRQEDGDLVCLNNRETSAELAMLESSASDDYSMKYDCTTGDYGTAIKHVK